MLPKITVALKTVWGIAFGGAAGALVNFFTSAGGDIGKVDWHKLGITAGVGAIVAVAMHYQVPPTVQK